MFHKAPHSLVCILALMLVGGHAPSQTPKPSTVHIHPDYEFTPSIEAEHDTLQEFFDLYASSVALPSSESRYGLALTSLTLGLVKEDPYDIVTARALFAANVELAKEGREVELSRLGINYANAILSGNYSHGSAPKQGPAPVTIAKVPVPASFRKIILGRSAIQVGKKSLIKIQVDRVTRDWLTGVNTKNAPWTLIKPELVPFHEGAKATELIELTGARVIPVFGTKVRRFGKDWYAPDAAGIYRFPISEDKVVNYPTTFIVDDYNAVLNDSHGISAIAWDCLDADLALGCGDHKGKIEAAYYLAEKGVNVYVPTDRYLGLLIGTQTKGTVIGSAPVKKAPGGAVIGAQSITIDVAEPIVVCTAKGKYPLQYYDTPLRYFTALAEYCGRKLNLTAVEVKEYGNATNVIAEARRLNVKLIGMRVKSNVEHDAVAAWLKEDKSRRAVLFHTAVYPDGYKLFYEFPEQTSFGDINPIFE